MKKIITGIKNEINFTEIKKQKTLNYKDQTIYFTGPKILNFID